MSCWVGTRRVRCLRDCGRGGEGRGGEGRGREEGRGGRGGEREERGERGGEQIGAQYVHSVLQGLCLHDRYTLRILGKLE